MCPIKGQGYDACLESGKTDRARHCQLHDQLALLPFGCSARCLPVSFTVNYGTWLSSSQWEWPDMVGVTSQLAQCFSCVMFQSPSSSSPGWIEMTKRWKFKIESHSAWVSEWLHGAKLPSDLNYSELEHEQEINWACFKPLCTCRGDIFYPSLH